jgi:hypothetical protein
MPEFFTEICGCLVCLAVLIAVAVVWPVIFLCAFGIICKKRGHPDQPTADPHT